MSNAMSELMRFQVDRKLNLREYDWSVEATNIIEELLEAININDRNFAKSIVLGINESRKDKIDLGLATEPSEIGIVDAFADVIVFASGAITKLGYDPELVLTEVAKEINSREGSIIDGKFQKDKSEEAMAKWYTADFKDCKIQKVNEQQRIAFFRTNGIYGTNEEVEEWLNQLTTK